jgi:hypothetical protein
MKCKECAFYNSNDCAKENQYIVQCEDDACLPAAIMYILAEQFAVDKYDECMDGVTAESVILSAKEHANK